MLYGLASLHMSCDLAMHALGILAQFRSHSAPLQPAQCTNMIVCSVTCLSFQTKQLATKHAKQNFQQQVSTQLK